MTFASQNIRMTCVESHEIELTPGTSLEQLMSKPFDPSDRESLIERFQVPESGLPIATLDFFECDPGECSTADVLAQLSGMKIMGATLAHALALVVQDASIIDGLPPIVCLGSIWTDDSGLAQAPPVLWHTGSTVSIELSPLDEVWHDRCMIFGIRQ